LLLRLFNFFLQLLYLIYSQIFFLPLPGQFFVLLLQFLQLLFSLF